MSYTLISDSDGNVIYRQDGGSVSEQKLPPESDFGQFM